MTTPKTTSNLKKALALFVSVPMSAMPALAQDKTVSVRERLGVRAGARLSIVEGDKTILGIRAGVRQGIRQGIRVPQRTTIKK